MYSDSNIFLAVGAVILAVVALYYVYKLASNVTIAIAEILWELPIWLLVVIFVVFPPTLVVFLAGLFFAALSDDVGAHSPDSPESWSREESESVEDFHRLIRTGSHEELERWTVEGDLGSVVNARDVSDLTPLHTAVKARNHEALLWLLEKGAKVGATDTWGNTAQESAESLGDQLSAALLRSYSPDSYG